MKKNILNDERVINEKRKITNEAFSLIMLILISSILVQQFVFKAHFSEYATEFICFFWALIYILIRNISVGNKIINDDSKKKKIIITNCLVIGIVITIINGFQVVKESNNTLEIFITLIGTFLISTIAAAITMTVITKLNQHKINKIEIEFDDDNE